MATASSQRKQGNGVLKEAPGRVTRAVEANVTEKPSR